MISLINNSHNRHCNGMLHLCRLSPDVDENWIYWLKFWPQKKNLVLGLCCHLIWVAQMPSSEIFGMLTPAGGLSIWTNNALPLSLLLLEKGPLSRDFKNSTSTTSACATLFRWLFRCSKDIQDLYLPCLMIACSTSLSCSSASSFIISKNSGRLLFM